MSTTEDIMASVDDYYSDVSRPVSETREGLEDVIAQIQMKIEALPEEDGLELEMGDDEDE